MEMTGCSSLLFLRMDLFLGRRQGGGMVVNKLAGLLLAQRVRSFPLPSCIARSSAFV
jgi:hypothetical protein